MFFDSIRHEKYLNKFALEFWNQISKIFAKFEKRSFE